MRSALRVFIPVVLSGSLHAGRLPVRIYTPSDGLPGIAIHKIVRDSHGFLWFCTGEGLSRFDSYSFSNYDKAHGLPSLDVYGFLESRTGDYWVGTAEGLCRFNPAGVSPGRAMFEVVPAPHSEGATWTGALLEDRSGNIWVGTRDGLFQLQERSGGQRREWGLQRVPLGMPNAVPTDRIVTALIQDRQGRLWIGSINGLYLLGPRGDVVRYSTGSGLPHNSVWCLLADSKGRVWAGTTRGLSRFAETAAHAPLVDRIYTTRDGLPADLVTGLFETSHGSLWAATSGGVAELVQPFESFRAYTTAQGLSNDDTWSLAEDADGNLWIGTDSGGAAKLARNGFVTYGNEDGLGSPRVVSIFEDRSGKLCVVTKAPGQLFVNRWDGSRFTAIPVNASPELYETSWAGWYQVAFESRRREWWVASAGGLLRFPAAGGLRHRNPRRYGTKEGLPRDHVHQVFEDSRGAIWISTRDPAGNDITRWDTSSETFYRFSEADGLPPLKIMRANGFFEDRVGQIWIGLHRVGVLRYVRKRFQVFLEADGVPPGGIRRFHQDRQGRLWLGSGQGGLARIDDPQAARPAFVTYNTSTGLSGNEIQAITEDRWGRLYVGTGHGVDRLDPATGQVHRYTTADGLAGGEVQTAFGDRNGVLWFGTVQGVSRLVPVQEDQHRPPPIRLMGIRVAGRRYRIAENGASELSLPPLPAHRNNITLDFVGLSFAPGEVLRYQYRLEAADEDWSLPTNERSVVFANLAPGRYRFLVRALNSDAAISPRPAVLAFEILPPLWRRWWFLALAAAGLVALSGAAYRYHLKRAVEFECLRTRIASDLHDEIGSGLSQIAILSEVAQKAAPGNAALTRTAEISRELVDSMSDIVWAINPAKDRFNDLAHRMRRFASEVFEAAGIEFKFVIGDLPQERKIGLDMRRQVYLIFREAVRNVLRHSRCRHSAVSLAAQGGYLVLCVVDDGGGFKPDPQCEGHGLASMRERARALGGQIEWRSSASGTSVTLTLPLHK